MQHLITPKQRHLLYKDELGDTFLLTKDGEIYQYSDKILRIHTFHKHTLNKLRRNGLIFNEWGTDDGLGIADLNVENLQKLLALYRVPSRRFQRNAKWFAWAEERLAHKIIPFNTQSLRAPKDGTM